MVVALMKKNSGIVLCGNENEPTIEITLEKDEVPEDIEDAIDKIQNEWEWG